MAELLRWIKPAAAIEDDSKETEHWTTEQWEDCNYISINDKSFAYKNVTRDFTDEQWFLVEKAIKNNSWQLLEFLVHDGRWTEIENSGVKLTDANVMDIRIAEKPAPKEVTPPELYRTLVNFGKY